MFNLKKLFAISAAALVIGIASIVAPMASHTASADCPKFLVKCVEVNENVVINKKLRALPPLEVMKLAWVPTATILHPSAGQQYDAREVASHTFAATVWLVGHGYDREDGTLSGSSLVWTTSINGGPDQFLGTGKQMWAQLHTDGISPYTHHTVKLTVTDSDGNSHSDTVGVTVYLDGRIVF